MTIQRFGTETRWSQVVVHNGVAYVAGQVGTPHESAGEQMREILALIDSLLAEAGSDRTKLLSAQIWLADMREAEEMNAVWDSWVPEGHAPARTCVETRLGEPGTRVEVTVTAAV